MTGHNSGGAICYFVTRLFVLIMPFLGGARTLQGPINSFELIEK